MSKKKSTSRNTKAKNTRSASRRSGAGASQRSNMLWVWLGLALVVALFATGALLMRQTAAPATANAPAAVAAQGDAALAGQALSDEVTVDEAAALRQQGAFMLDVREPSEWAEYHMPGATLIPLGELETRLSEVPRDQEVVVVCRSGNRSAVGRDLLKDAGFTQVTSMAGGMKAWDAAGYEIETGS